MAAVQNQEEGARNLNELVEVWMQGEGMTREEVLADEDFRRLVLGDFEYSTPEQKIRAMLAVFEETPTNQSLLRASAAIRNGVNWHAAATLLVALPADPEEDPEEEYPEGEDPEEEEEEHAGHAGAEEEVIQRKSNSEEDPEEE